MDAAGSGRLQPDAASPAPAPHRSGRWPTPPRPRPSRLAAAAVDAARGGAPAVDPTGGGGGRGRGGFGGGGGPAVSAHKGLNSATWNPQLPSPFTVPPRIVMWGGGAGPMKAATGVYTVKVSMGSWSQTQTFRLNSDPRLTPPVTDAESQAQLKMAQEVGGWAKQLYDRLAQIRDAKSQADGARPEDARARRRREDLQGQRREGRRRHDAAARRGESGRAELPGPHGQPGRRPLRQRRRR